MQYTNLHFVSCELLTTYSVDSRCDLDDHGCSSDSQQWAPEVFHRVLCINVANISESKRYSSNRDRYCEEGSNY